MDCPIAVTCPRIHLLHNSVYEFKKGVRHLFLLTASRAEIAMIRQRLNIEQIDFFEQEVNATKINVFFGKAALVETARHIATKPLNQMSPEEDFMLGTLLNYDKEQQCLRFLAMSRKQPGSRSRLEAVAS